MQHLIARVLQAHEVETERALDLQPRDLMQALGRALGRHQATAARYDIELHRERAEFGIHALIDEYALEQVLDNLITNAIRFSPKGGRVTLRALQQEAPFIEIADEGAGLDERARLNLFKKFGRGELRPVNGEWGSGLGLFIVKTLTRSMGGDVHYRNARESGSVFRVELVSAKHFDKGVSFNCASD